MWHVKSEIRQSALDLFPKSSLGCSLMGSESFTASFYTKRRKHSACLHPIDIYTYIHNTSQYDICVYAVCSIHAQRFTHSATFVSSSDAWYVDWGFGWCTNQRPTAAQRMNRPLPLLSLLRSQLSQSLPEFWRTRFRSYLSWHVANHWKWKSSKGPAIWCVDLNSASY